MTPGNPAAIHARFAARYERCTGEARQLTRDEIAMEVMLRLLVLPAGDPMEYATHTSRAVFAYGQADAILKERAR
jgi:hypothetical protein